jgi:hypothetical protein
VLTVEEQRRFGAFLGLESRWLLASSDLRLIAEPQRVTARRSPVTHRDTGSTPRARRPGWTPRASRPPGWIPIPSRTGWTPVPAEPRLDPTPSRTGWTPIPSRSGLDPLSSRAP